MIRARCPKDPKHDRFVAGVMVCQDWLVDENGDFIELIEIHDGDAHPDPENTWYCEACGEDAIVTVKEGT